MEKKDDNRWHFQNPWRDFVSFVSVLTSILHCDSIINPTIQNKLAN